MLHILKDAEDKSGSMTTPISLNIRTSKDNEHKLHK